MVYNDNPLYRQTKLYEYVNIASGSGFLRLYRFKDLLYTHDHDIKEYNKKNMSIVLPDISPHYTNYNINLARNNGCQFIGLSFQNYDDNLKYYNQLFDGGDERSAFSLKPESFRYVETYTEKPHCPTEDLSYKPRKTDLTILNDKKLAKAIVPEVY